MKQWFCVIPAARLAALILLGCLAGLALGPGNVLYGEEAVTPAPTTGATTAAAVASELPPVRFRKVYVPQGQLEAVRDPVPYFPMTTAEFERMVQEANQRAAFQGQTARIVRAVYRANVRNTDLVGLEGEWDVQLLGGTSAILRLGKVSFFLGELSWADRGAAQVPILTDQEGNSSIVLERSGKIHFRWSAKGTAVNGQGLLRFELSFPPAVENELALYVGDRFSVRAEGGLVFLNPAPSGGARGYRIAFQNGSKLTLTLESRRGDRSPLPYGECSQNVNYELRPEGLQATWQWSLDIQGQPVEHLVLHLPSDLRVADVKLGETPLSWEANRTDDALPGSLVVSLPEPLRGRGQQVSLRGFAKLPCDRLTLLPTVSLDRFFCRSGTVEMVVRNPLEVRDLKLKGAQLKEVTPLPDLPGDTAITVTTSPPSAEIQVLCGFRPASVEQTGVMNVAIGPSAITCNLRLAARAEQDPVFALDWLVPKNWDVLEVSADDVSRIEEWQVLGGEEESGHNRLTIRLKKPLLSQSAILFRIKMQRPITPAQVQFGLSELLPILRRGFCDPGHWYFTLTLDPQLGRHRTGVWEPELTPLGQSDLLTIEGLYEASAGAGVYPLVEDWDEVHFKLLPKQTPYLAQVEVVVAKAEGQLDERCRVNVVCDEDLEQLTLWWTNQEAGSRFAWFLLAPDDTNLPIKTVLSEGSPEGKTSGITLRLPQPVRGSATLVGRCRLPFREGEIPLPLLADASQYEAIVRIIEPPREGSQDQAKPSGRWQAKGLRLVDLDRSTSPFQEGGIIEYTYQGGLELPLVSLPQLSLVDGGSVCGRNAWATLGSVVYRVDRAGVLERWHFFELEGVLPGELRFRRVEAETLPEVIAITLDEQPVVFKIDGEPKGNLIRVTVPSLLQGRARLMISEKFSRSPLGAWSSLELGRLRPEFFVAEWEGTFWSPPGYRPIGWEALQDWGFHGREWAWRLLGPLQRPPDQPIFLPDRVNRMIFDRSAPPPNLSIRRAFQFVEVLENRWQELQGGKGDRPPQAPRQASGSAAARGVQPSAASSPGGAGSATPVAPSPGASTSVATKMVSWRDWLSDEVLEAVHNQPPGLRTVAFCVDQKAFARLGIQPTTSLPLTSAAAVFPAATGGPSVPGGLARQLLDQLGLVVVVTRQTVVITNTVELALHKEDVQWSDPPIFKLDARSPWFQEIEQAVANGDARRYIRIRVWNDLPTWEGVGLPGPAGPTLRFTSQGRNGIALGEANLADGRSTLVILTPASAGEASRWLALLVAFGWGWLRHLRRRFRLFYGIVASVVLAAIVPAVLAPLISGIFLGLMLAMGASLLVGIQTSPSAGTEQGAEIPLPVSPSGAAVTRPSTGGGGAKASAAVQSPQGSGFDQAAAGESPQRPANTQGVRGKPSSGPIAADKATEPAQAQSSTRDAAAKSSQSDSRAQDVGKCGQDVGKRAQNVGKKPSSGRTVILFLAITLAATVGHSPFRTREVALCHCGKLGRVGSSGPEITRSATIATGTFRFDEAVAPGPDQGVSPLGPIRTAVVNRGDSATPERSQQVSSRGARSQTRFVSMQIPEAAAPPGGGQPGVPSVVSHGIPAGVSPGAPTEALTGIPAEASPGVPAGTSPSIPTGGSSAVPAAGGPSGAMGIAPSGSTGVPASVSTGGSSSGPTIGASASTTETPPYRVFIPADDGGNPVGSEIYVPQGLYQELQRRAFPPAELPRKWHFASATYRGGFVPDVSGSGWQLGQVLANFECWITEAPTTLDIPLGSAEVAPQVSDILLDGGPVAASWDQGRLQIVVPEAGRFRIQVPLALAPQNDGAYLQVRSAIPPVTNARLELTAPYAMTRLDVPSALGQVENDPEGGRWIAELGLTDQLTIRWPATSDPRAAVTGPQTDTLYLLRFTPDGVVWEVSWHVRLYGVRMEQAQLLCDPRWRLERLTSDAQTKFQLVPGKEAGSFQILFEPPLEKEATLMARLTEPLPGGMGGIVLPEVQLAGVTPSRHELVVVPDTQFSLLMDEPVGWHPAEVTDILERWQLASEPGMQGFECLRRPAFWGAWVQYQAPVPRVEETIRLLAAADGVRMRWQARIAPTASAGTNLFRVKLPPNLRLKQVAIFAGAAEKGYPCHPSPDGILTFFLPNLLGGDVGLVVDGQMPLDADGQWQMQLPELLDSQRESVAITLSRTRQTAVQIVESTGLSWLAPVAAPAGESREVPLGNSVARPPEDVALRLQISRVQSKISSAVTLRVAEASDGWQATASLDLNIEQGNLSQLELTFLGGWADPVKVDGADAFHWSSGSSLAATEPDDEMSEAVAKKGVLIFDPPRTGRQKITLTGRLLRDGQGTLAVPLLQLPVGIPARYRLLLPKSLAWEERMVDLLGIVPIAEKELIAMGGAKEEIGYDVTAAARLPALQLPEVAAFQLGPTEVELDVKSDGSALGHLTLPISAGGQHELPFTVPPGAEVLAAWLDGRRIPVFCDGRGVVNVPLEGAPEHFLELLFRTESAGSQERGRIILPVPKVDEPGGQKAEQSRGFLAIDAARGWTVTPDRADPMSGWDYYLVLGRVAIRQWQQRTTPGGGVPSEAALTALARYVAARERGKRAFMIANPLAATTAADARFHSLESQLVAEFPDFGELLALAQRQTGAWHLFQGDVNEQKQMRFFVADSLPQQIHWVREIRSHGWREALLVAGLIAGAAAFAGLIRRVARPLGVWVMRSAHALAVLAGISWWLWLQPSFVGWLLILASLGLLIRSRWRWVPKDEATVPLIVQQKVPPPSQIRPRDLP